MSIPSVDLGEFFSGDQEIKNRFVKQITRAYEEIGFVAVKDHGISEELIANRAEQHEDINLITL
jgi:isopenicillin N synthase-like dioxygenase